MIYARGIVCMFKVLSEGGGVHFPAAESVAWHSVCSLWPSDVPRSCNLGHSCFPLMFRGWTFILSQEFIPFPYQNRRGRNLSGIRGKMLFILLHCYIGQSTLADISPFFPVLDAGLRPHSEWSSNSDWHFISLLIATSVIWPPLCSSNMFQIFHLQHRPVVKKQVKWRVAVAAETLSGFF